MAERSGRLDPEEVDQLISEYLERPTRRARNRIVEAHMGLASSRARRMARSASHDDDLEQVAFLALVKAMDRFDPTKGASFATFAVRTVDGELKRHLRDATWDVRVPRSLKELHVSVRSVTAELSQRLGHSPSVGEIADELGVSRDDVLSALGAGTARATDSLDSGSEGDDSASAGAAPPAQDRQIALAVSGEFELVENSHVLDSLLQSVDSRDREILRLRFAERLSQDEIARRVGVSQMQVSRLLRRTLDELRAQASAPEDV